MSLGRNIALPTFLAVSSALVAEPRLINARPALPLVLPRPLLTMATALVGVSAASSLALVTTAASFLAVAAA